MPYQNKRLGCWVGQVKKTVTGEQYEHLSDLPYWKQKGQDSYLYRRDLNNFPTKKAAAKWEVEHLKEITSILENPEISITFSTASMQYLQQVAINRTGKNTLQYKKKLIKDILAFWGKDHPIPVSTLDIESFLNHQYKVQGGKKANRSLREFTTLFNWMLKREMIDSIPTIPIEKYTEKTFKKYVPPKDDIITVIAHANAFEKDILRTAYHSLARSGEIRNIRKRDCDFVNNTLELHTRKRKGGALESDKIKINKSLREILLRRSQLVEGECLFSNKSGLPLSKNTIDKILPRLFEKINRDETGNPKQKEAQIKPFGLHAIRHHVTADLYLNHGYSVGELQKLLRHKRASTTEVYLSSIVDMDAPRGLDVLDEFESKPAAIKDTNLIHFEGKIG
jgi:integrase